MDKKINEQIRISLISLRTDSTRTENCSKKLLIPRDRSSWFYFSIFSYISIVISEMIKITKEVNPIHGD
ncbi:uncharacterized protein OCT59_005679 [Rhizophagus irregularis]|uniref:uncharacterized protein n=1 Tax=Rhizophagus irregularis TaxID=588596 RepID=UPI0003BAC27A|nr:hypothetical protein OCT59_005679 [Rhizophagus irregularis]GBC37663.1 hypothetical protein RIR_jg18750.t1 [Rhizophagus irregularis DAOM 181602=DAOM 197198]CAB4384762.1 unnamed protein product [Rhizophagus irregularis]CAB4495704.1 unnamed protein product [Rhizophagus irregularis]CAB5388671.1 unnamed protein product [Rhizophagus irregularis]